MPSNSKAIISFLFYAILAISIMFTSHPAFAGGKGDTPNDGTSAKVSKIGEYKGYSEPTYKGFKYASYYVTMRDSVRLAVDVFLPKKLEEGKQVPTIFYQTRYVRSLKAKWPFNWLKHPVLAQIPEDEVKFFTSHGYAVVIVDARGSGASEGARVMEFSPDEVKDGGEVVDWVIKRPWSNGLVGTTGVSYVGTTAELLLVNQHPAVKACIPRSNIFDLYGHVMFPGGVRQGPFVKVWGYTTKSLDGNYFDPFGKQAKRLVWGINPVQGDKGKKTYKQVLEDHKGNFDVYDGLLKVEYRDEVHPDMVDGDLTPDDFSIHNYVDNIENSGAAIYRIGGWYDGALPKSVIDGYLNTSNTEKVLMGPWDHGPGDNASPWAESKERTFDLFAEMLRFFDFHLKGIDNGIDKEPTFYYYTIREQEWKYTNTWPPAETKSMTYHFSEGNALTNNLGEWQPGSVDYQVDYTANTGNRARWNSVTTLYKNGKTHYADRGVESSKLLNFEAAPFDQDIVMTGHPLVELYISADAKDATVFCYIEDVGPDGSVTYVTEGMLRAKNRALNEDKALYQSVGPYHSHEQEDVVRMEPGEIVKMGFDMIPISYQFKKGHTMRVSIAGADVEHFDLFEERPETLTLHYSGEYPSHIVIPFEPVAK